MKIFSLLFVISMAIQPVAIAEGEVFSVMEVAGRAEMLDPSGVWRPLAPRTALAEGARVRTGPKSWALFLLSSGVEEAMELEADSTMNLSAGAASVRLEEGRLYLMMEEGGPRPFFSVITPRGSIKIKTGGCLIEVSHEGVEWRVFGEESRIQTKTGDFTVSEGFKFRLTGKGHSLSRLSFSEYAEWQKWTRKWYEKKDDAVYDVWEESVT